MAQFAIDEVLTTGIQISGFIFDYSSSLGTPGQVLASTTSGVMWQADSSIVDLSSLSGQIAATGSLLNNRINSLSGYSDATFATITNLATTGSTLDTKINTLSGYSNANFATILNLATTGSTLDTKINSLSGYEIQTFLSGSGTQYYVPRWNTSKQLVTGSIYDNGNVGIGTTGPVALLDLFSTGAINGPMLSIRSDFTAVGKHAMIRFGDKTQTTLYQKGAIIYEGVAGSARGRMHIALENTDGTGTVTLSDARLTVLSNGFVGVGTTNPITKFHVYEATNGNNWGLFAGNVGATLPSAYTYGILIGSNYSNGFSESNIVWGNGISSNQYFAIGRASGSGFYSEQLRIDINGNVGIGLTTPTSKLHVVETTATGTRIQLGVLSSSTLMNAGSTNDLLILNVPYGNNPAGASNIGAKWGIKFIGSTDALSNSLGKTSAIYAVSEDTLGYNRGTSLAFYTNQLNDEPYAERMRIYHNGNIGIGTNGPTTLLSVGGAGSASAASGLTFGGDASANLYRISSSRIKTDGSLEVAIGIISPTITSLSGNIAATGSTLDTKINTLSGYSNANFATITNLAATGSTLDTKINTLSGYSNANFATVLNLAATGSTLDTKINTLSGYSNANFATITNLAATGSTLDTKINTLSGYSNANFATILNLAATGSVLDTKINTTNTNLAATGSTLDTKINTTNTNLAATGSTLDTKINTLSGYSNANFATILNLAATGSVLDTKINTTNTNLAATGSTLDTKINTTNTNLAATGSTLDARINSLSGYAGSTFLSGQGVANWTARWNGTKELITGSIYDIGTAVGIGTASPSTKLHLYEASAADVTLRLTPSNGAYDPVFQMCGEDNNIATEGFEIWYDNNVGDVHLSTTYANDAAAIRFHTRVGASKNTSNERLTILGNGKVGIGTASPTTLLSVGGAGSASAASGITFGGDASANLYRSAAGTLKTDGRLNIVGDADNSTPDLFFNGAGGFGSAGGQVRAWSPNNTTLSWYWDDTQFTYNNFPLRIVDGSSNVLVYFSATASSYVNGGNLGVGTATPSGKLHVVSSVAGGTVFRADGTNGTLFSVVDDLSDSLMSVNNSAGLPVLEVFADDRIVAGQYGSGDFVIVNNKVGIGTSNPSYKLDINGSLGINASTSDTNWPFVVSDNSSAGSRYGLNKAGSMGFNNADNYAQLQLLGTNGAYLDLTNSVGGDSNARLIYYASNRLDLTYGFISKGTISLNSNGVGIGTTNPAWALDVSGTAIRSFATGAVEPGFIADYASSNGYGGFFVHADGTRKWRIAVVGDTNASPALSIWQEGIGSRMHFRNNGALGVGTTIPDTKLSIGVASDSALGSTSDGLKITDGTRNVQLLRNGTGYNYAGVVGSGSMLYSYDRMYIVADTSNPILFHTAGAERVRIGNDGNVGIGVTNPTNTLQVNGQIAIKGDESADNVKIHIQASDNSNRYTIKTDLDGTTTNDLLIFRSDTVDNMLVLKGNGNVGIGVANPACKLDVSGTIRSSTNEIYGFGASDNVSLRAASSLNVLGIYTSNVERLRVDANGYLGIGLAPSTLLSVGPVGSTLPASGLTFGGDAEANLYRSAEDTIKTDGNLVVAGTTSLNGHIYGKKTVTLTTASYTTVLTVNLTSHTSCYVKIGAFGDWGAHSAVAFVSELFIQNGDNAYNTPGTIITAHDNTAGAAGDKIDIQILDPLAAGTQNFLIQLKLISATLSTNSSIITYHVMGQQASVT